MPLPEVTWTSCMELSGIFCPWPTGCEISIAPVLWPASITSRAAARAPPTTSTTASAARAGLRSRGALGSRRPAGEVGSRHAPASAPAPVPRGIVPLSLDIGPVLPWLQHLLVAQAVPIRTPPRHACAPAVQRGREVNLSCRRSLPQECHQHATGLR